jgi:integrase/recombinase XerC
LKKLLDKKRELFLLYLEKQRGYSQLTVKSYDAVLKEAFEYIAFTQEEEHLLFDLMPYRIYIAKLNAKTISKKLSAVRSFVNYLNENEMRVILRADESIKVAKTLPKPISHKHIMEALEKASLEERLIVLMLYTLGLRISELSSLKVSNITPEWIRIIGKGNKERDIPLLSSVKKLIDEYLSNISVNRYLFEKNGERLSENSLRYVITKVFGRVALKVTPHQLRHSYASSLLNNGAPIVDVSELLGHASMATTQIYTKLGSALKQQNYNKAHPLCRGEI